jgi:hypothetical protein
MIAPHLFLLITIAVMTVGPVKAAEERLPQHGGSSDLRFSPPTLFFHLEGERSDAAGVISLTRELNRR